MRGYFGIGIYHPKCEVNIGTLWRTAHNFGAAFIFTIGHRYRRQPSDTTNAGAHVPLLEYVTLADFEAHKPYGCQTVCIELSTDARDLRQFYHPARAAYLLGAEDHGLPGAFLQGKEVVQVPGGKRCLNVAVAGSIVLYDRYVKQTIG